MSVYSNNYIVPPISRSTIRQYAAYVREQLGIKTIYFPIEKMLENLRFITGVEYDIVDDYEWGELFDKNSQAQFNLCEKIIYIRNSVYEGAIIGKGRDRFTIAHEIAHSLLLDIKKVAVCRADKNIPVYNDPEWQANCLAGEILVPYNLCRDMDVDEIVEKCKVSKSAAVIQKSKF